MIVILKCTQSRSKRNVSFAHSLFQARGSQHLHPGQDGLAHTILAGNSSRCYYYYNQFWLAPSMFGCWILAAGTAHLLSRLFSGKGSFEDTLSVFGFEITIATLFALLHDLPDSFLGAIGILDMRWYELALNSPTIWVPSF